MIENIKLREHHFYWGVVAEGKYMDLICTIFTIDDLGIIIRDNIAKIIGVDEI